jgi:HSP20 family protein
MSKLNKNLKLLGIGLVLVNSLSATTLNNNDNMANLDQYYKQIHNDMMNFFANDSFLHIPIYKYISNINLNYPKMNMFQKDNQYRFEFELAGIDKKDIKVELSNQNILTISGVKKSFTKNEKKDLMVQEQFFGNFSRSITLPDDIDPNSIQVKFKNGILTVTIKKDKTKSANKTKVLPIQ